MLNRRKLTMGFVSLSLTGLGIVVFRDHPPLMILWLLQSILTFGMIVGDRNA